jgi:hypothetical protein
MNGLYSGAGFKRDISFPIPDNHNFSMHESGLSLEVLTEIFINKILPEIFNHVPLAQNPKVTFVAGNMGGGRHNILICILLTVCMSSLSLMRLESTIRCIMN